MDNLYIPKEMQMYRKSEDKEYRLVKKYGETFVEVRYKGSEWTGWLFKASKVAKKYYRYVPELDIYMCNVSYG